MLALGAALAAAAANPAQDVSLTLVPDATELRDCPGEEFAITLRIENPGEIEVGGFQLALSYPTEYIEPIQYVPIAGHSAFAANGRPPFGGGFLNCTLAEDDWDDGAGSDVVFVVASLLDQTNGDGLDDEAIDVGRILFRALARPAAAGAVTVSADVEPCMPLLDSAAAVFDAAGNKAPSQGLPAPVDLVLTDQGAHVEGFRCADRGAVVVLEWNGVAEGPVVGYRIFRDGAQIAQILLPNERRYDDPSFTGEAAVYEIAPLTAGLQERCRSTCRLERNPPFTRGDVDRDANISITDAVLVLGRLFQGAEIRCDDAADFNDDGVINLTDAVNLLAYRFQGGAAPPAPFPGSGRDPTNDDLGCRL